MDIIWHKYKILFKEKEVKFFLLHSVRLTKLKYFKTKYI